MCEDKLTEEYELFKKWYKDYSNNPVFSSRDIAYFMFLRGKECAHDAQPTSEGGVIMIEKMDLARQMADMKDSDHWLKVIALDLFEEKLNEVIDALNNLPQWSYTNETHNVGDTISTCTCNQHKRGELTCGWHCPEHGHQL